MANDHLLPQAPAAQAPAAPRQSIALAVCLNFCWDFLSTQPARLNGACIAEFKTSFCRSYLLNSPI